MSHKMTCPVCNGHTSAIAMAVFNGLPCPECGTPAAIISEVDNLQGLRIEENLRKRLEEVLAENGALRARLSKLEQKLANVEYALRDNDD